MCNDDKCDRHDYKQFLTSKCVRLEKGKIMSTPVNRFTLNHESAKHEFRNHKKLGQGIWVREQAHNAASHGATQCDIISIDPKVKSISKAYYYVAFVHNGQKFSSFDQLKSSLMLGMSNEETKGVNGSGGKISSMYFIDKESDFQPTILAKLENGETVMFHSKIGEFREILIVQNTPEQVEDVVRCLGDLWSSANVAYLAPFNAQKNKAGGEYAFQTGDSMSVVPDLIPKIIGMRNFNVTYYDNVICSNEKPFGKQTGWEKSGTNFVSTDEFDRMFIDDRPYKMCGNASIKSDGYRVEFEVEVEVKLFTGLKRNDGKGEHRYGMISLRGPDKGKGKMFSRGVSKQKQNVYLFASWTDENNLHRLNDDPYHIGDHIDTAASILGLACSSRAEPFLDVEQHQELSEFVEKSKDESSSLMRNPFAKIYIKIKKINSISDTISGEIVPDWSRSDIRSIFGGFNEVFLTKDKELSKKVVEASLNAIVDNALNESELKLMRDRAKKMWPINLEKLCKLPITGLSGNKERKLIFSVDGSNLAWQKPNTTQGGKLCYEDGRIVDGEIVKFVGIEGSRKNSLQYQGDDDWALRVCDYHLVNSDGNYEKLSESEFLLHSPQDTVPNREIKFLEKNSNLEYVLNTRVILPIRSPHKHKGAIPVEKGVVDVNSQRMFKAFSPVEKYVHFANNESVLNTENHLNKFLWLDIPEKKSFRESCWVEINDLCRSFQFKVRDTLRIKGFSDELHSKELQEKWNDDAEDYLLNMWLGSVLFETPRIARVIEEIKDIIERHTPSSDS